VNEIVLNDGGPIVIEDDGSGRIGRGAWARLFASAIVPDEGSARAERGREFACAGAVSEAMVAPGAIRARVRGSSGSDYAVAIETDILPSRVWDEAARAARERPALETGVEGTSQSVHLALYLESELHEPLVPAKRRVRTSCTCPDREYASVCKHVAALAFAIADAIDSDPSLLLRWRGCEPVASPASRSSDPWRAGALPRPRPLRALPPGAVVKRLGRSGIRVGGRDLAEALVPAYRVFARVGPAGARPGMIDPWSSDSAS
jgi:hypothetical protein